MSEFPSGENVPFGLLPRPVALRAGGWSIALVGKSEVPRHGIVGWNAIGGNIGIEVTGDAKLKVTAGFPMAAEASRSVSGGRLHRHSISFKTEVFSYTTWSTLPP